MTDLSKEKRINKELKRLNKLFDQVDENQKSVVAPLLQNASFMKVTLEDLQEIVNREGVTDEYKNGANQHGTKQSAVLQSYNSLIKNYSGVMKTLSQLLPRATKKYIQELPPREKTAEEIEADRKRLQEESEYWSRIAKEIRSE